MGTTMADWKYVLFDLDGTITNSSKGIIRCIEYALHAAGRPIPEERVLLQFIGPPLVIGFQEFMGMTREEAEWFRDKYRERYQTIGAFEAELYAGIDQVLAMLKQQGKKISLATSKPEETAIRILDHFGLLSYFDETAGATMDGSRDSKEDVIREALDRFHITEDQKDRVLMVGDRNLDIAGAKRFGIASLGVYYGFAEPGELEAAGADYIARDMDALQQFFDTSI